MISYSSNWEKKFGYKPDSEGSLSRIPNASHLFQKIPSFLALMESIRNGVPYRELEIRIAIQPVIMSGAG